MRKQGDLIKAFEKGATKGTASNMFIEGDILYSYGGHFPLVVRLKNKSNGAFLINGDDYSRSTSQQQSECFHLGPQIPFSAIALLIA